MRQRCLWNKGKTQKEQAGERGVNLMKSFTKLYIPIALETLCYMLAGMVDTIMLSAVGDDAVGAVGTANTYISVFIIMFSVVSSGMIAVMTQYIGAKKIGVAYQARQLGAIFNFFFRRCSGNIFRFFFRKNIGSCGSSAASDGSCKDLFEDSGRFLLFKCSDSHFFKLSEGFWTYQTAVDRFLIGKCCESVSQCGLPICIQKRRGRCGCRYCHIKGFESCG